MPHRLSRIVAALIAVAAAAFFLGLSAAPAGADQVRHEQWWLSSAGIAGTWAASQGADVTVAVLSDGVQPGQPDLSGAVSFAPAPAGAPVAASPYAGEVGTALASLIAGHGHGTGGAAGLIGVAPAARILSVPVTLPDDDPVLTAPSVAAAIPAAIAAGIRYAVSHGAQVIDLPIDPGQPGNAGYAGDAAAAGGSQAEQSAITFALRHDVVLVAPAGDDAAAGDAANYPAAYRAVIAVGATDSGSRLAPWSSRQGYVALTAPGTDMVAVSSAGGYQAVSSTSAASAIVAGVAALIRARYPALTADQVRQALVSGTAPRPAGQSAAGWGSGGVDAVAAMTAAARLGTPATQLAGSRARPHVAPAAARPAPHGLAAGIERAGLISGALLAVLLLLIGGWLVLRRRRRPVPEPAPVQLTPPQSPYSRPRGADANGTAGAILVRAPEPAHAGSVDAAGRAGPPPGRATDSPYPPASRGTGRRPAVSGSPPWEPAVAPTTKLPWTSSAGRHSAGARPIQSGRIARARPVPPPASARHDSLDRNEGGPGEPAPPAARPEPRASLPNREHRELAATAGPSPTGSPDPAGPPVHRAPRPPVPMLPSPTADGGLKAPSGLPVRRPGATQSAPLSPSGSLWQSPDTASGGSLWERPPAGHRGSST